MHERVIVVVQFICLLVCVWQISKITAVKRGTLLEKDDYLSPLNVLLFLNIGLVPSSHTHLSFMIGKESSQLKSYLATHVVHSCPFALLWGEALLLCFSAFHWPFSRVQSVALTVR